MSSRRGFTPTELLIVLGIIILLIAAFLPAIQASRQAAHRVACENNSKQLAIGMHNHHDMHGYFPPGWTSGGVTPFGDGYGWGALLLPHMEQTGLAGSFMMSEPLTFGQNLASADTVINIFRCPQDTGSDNVTLVGVHPANTGKFSASMATSSYVACFGSNDINACDIMNQDFHCDGNGIFFRNSRVRLGEIEDGSSHTILIGERFADQKPAIWAGAPSYFADAILRVVGHARTHPNDLQDAGGFGSSHRGGAMFTLADGSVHFLTDDIESNVYRALATRKGRELRARIP